MNIARFTPPRILVSLGILALTGCGPVYTLPGGALSGVVSEIPDNWAVSREFDTVQIQTNPQDPYSVNIWGVDLGSSFYVTASGGAESTWAKNMVENPAVVLRLGEELYPLWAVRVENADQIDAVEARYVEKYDIDPDDNFVHSAWVFRLDPRP